MASETEEKIVALIVDSAGFLKNVPVQNIAQKIFTIKEVISEIKSASIRERLAVLPYEINFRVPSNESLHVVSEFAKKTGDFQSLSIVDLKVLALTFQLHKEECGKEGLREEPTKQIEVIDKQPQGKIPGFFVKNKVSGSGNKEDVSNIDGNVDELLASNDEANELLLEVGKCSLNEAHELQTVTEKQNSANPCENVSTHSVVDNGNIDEKSLDVDVNEKCLEEDEHVGEVDKDDIVDKDDKNDIENDDEDFNDDHQDDDEDFDDDDVLDDDDDDGDWITPDNITQVKAEFGVPETDAKPTNVVVGCLTTDFAMQNVLIQMGLHVISVDGMLIKEARSYVLKCYSCFKVTTQMQRLFCPNCGNRTLVKVAVSVDEQGVTHYHMPRRKKPFNIRGKKHPLPLPKGGRYSNNPLLFEDQLISQKRLPKPKESVNALDQDYVARSSPFAVKDTTSRAFNLGFHVHGQNRRNPNEGRKKTRRKKK